MARSAPLQGKRLPAVLVVEDQAAIVELLGTLMAPMGVRFCAARDGHQALRVLGETRPALITLDMVLPEVDGFGLLEHIRQRHELDDVPVLAISAQADSATQKRAYRGGISDFIAKPFSIDMLEAKLRMWLRLSQLGDFAHQMRDFTHEAKNPLSAIAAAAQVAGRKEADEDAELRRRLLRTIIEETDRLGRLLSTYTLGEVPAGQPATLSPLRLVQDVVEVNLPEAQRERVRVRFTSPVPAVRVEPDRLRQMLVNLLENALAATETGGTVAIEALVEPAGVALAVHDSGVGIAAADLLRVFDDGFTTRQGGARGLGLGITQRLCQSSGGRIQASSTPGRGTTFALWLPR